MDQARWRGAFWLILGLLVAAPSAAVAGQLKIEGYAEWRRGDVLVVDGQRIKMAQGASFKGEGQATSFASIPLGYEVKIKGDRLEHGTVLAQQVEAKPNGQSLFEGELKSAFDQNEQRFREKGRMCEEDESGKITEDYGRLLQSGPYVDRVRRLAARLAPPYAPAENFRVYAVENDEWNAMAAPNRSVYVFTGLLDDMDDDEVAIVLGHELAHATYEHSRKQFKKGILIQLAALGIVALAETSDNKTKKTIIEVAALLGATAWKNGYGRTHEDQADRVGLRYAYEGGFNVRKGPALWGRFAQKYGDSSKVLNFFFSEHSVAKDRARNLDRELAQNYSN